MKQFFSEYRTDYSTYTFSYAVYCTDVTDSELTDVYAAGFLPYTGDLSLDDDTFYLARSVRVDLDGFSNTSENRRVDARMKSLDPELKLVPKESFDCEAVRSKNSNDE